MAELTSTINGNFDDELADEDGEEDTNLLKGDKKKVDKGSCASQWKLLLSGFGVIVMVSLGVVIGATFNGKRRAHSLVDDVGVDKCDYNNIRLPGNVIPLKYRLYLHPNITNGKFDYTGSVKILVKTMSATDSIVLHAKNLDIKRAVLHVTNNLGVISNLPEVEIAGTSKNKKCEQLVITLGKVLPADRKYVLHIDFAGVLANVLDGFYKSSYTTSNGIVRYLATTHFEATGARTAFPCFDEPAMKARFEIIMVREKKHRALSNMPVHKSVPRKSGGLVTDFFQESVKMSTYLVAFVICDYAYLERNTSRGIQVRVWAPQEQITQGKFAVETAVKVLDYYEKFFKVDFPLPKMDLIAIPDFSSGAMENWGLITYRLTSILYKEGVSSSSNKQWVAEVVAHELAHQWFGNLVTMKWWNDLWLNEGFASFMDFVGGNHVAPEWKMMDQFVLRYVQGALALDAHLNSHAISVPVHDPAEIHELFDSISYDKGASIIRMMKDFIGADAFHEGLTQYLNKYKFGNAVSDDLWACLSNASGKVDVKAVMDTWTLQMGYPVIKVSRNSDNKGIAVQERFVVDEKSIASKPQNSKFDYKWDVHLTYHFQNDNETKRAWFYHDQTDVSFDWNLGSGWLKVNCEQIGFYRVNYAEDNWDALAKQLKDDHTLLVDADRSNLINDAFELAKANMLSYAQALDLTTYLNKENKYIPFRSALSGLGYIGGLLEGRPGYTIYKEYILSKIIPRVNELGWKDEGTHLEKYLRVSVLHAAVYYNDEVSVKTAKKIFNDWRFNNKWIPPDLRSTVYLAITKYGDFSQWNYMFNKYKTSLFPSEKKKLRYSLASTTNATILEGYLYDSLNDSVIRSQDSTSVIGAIAQNPVGQNMAIRFVKDNWNTLFRRYGGGSFEMSRLIKSVFGGLKTKEGLEDAKEFMKRDLGSGTRSGQQTLAIINNHIKWLQKNEGIVVNWLQKHVS